MRKRMLFLVIPGRIIPVVPGLTLPVIPGLTGNLK